MLLILVHSPQRVFLLELNENTNDIHPIHCLRVTLASGIEANLFGCFTSLDHSYSSDAGCWLGLVLLPVLLFHLGSAFILLVQFIVT